MKKLSISGYCLNYAGDVELSHILDDAILNKQACIDEMMKNVAINNTYALSHYDDNYEISILGIEM